MLADQKLYRFFALFVLFGITMGMILTLKSLFESFVLKGS